MHIHSVKRGCSLHPCGVCSSGELQLDLYHGCPRHQWQVSNITNTIKIACDFVFVEHLSTTFELLSTFCHHHISKQSRDDVLQLYTTLLHVWCSLFSFHELYSKHPDISFEGACSSYPDQCFYLSLTDCEGGHYTLRSSAAMDVNLFDEAIDVQANHVPPHVSLGLSLSTMHGSQHHRCQKAEPE
jgi:hypothetical protein